MAVHSKEKDIAQRVADDVRQVRGRAAYYAGQAAERSAALLYERRGALIEQVRWRGQGGEIDLILREGEVFVFVEVKKARAISDAVLRLSPAQMRRIHAAASEYLSAAPLGQLSEVRFDLAAVDQAGQIEIFENAFGHF